MCQYTVTLNAKMRKIFLWHFELILVTLTYPSNKICAVSVLNSKIVNCSGFLYSLFTLNLISITS